MAERRRVPKGIGKPDRRELGFASDIKTSNKAEKPKKPVD